MNNFSAAELTKAGRSVREPFQMSVDRDGQGLSIITVNKILRLLPGRRIVALAEQSGRKLLVKLFIGRGARRYANREVSGVLALEDSGVRTPFFEWRASLLEGGGEVLAFEYIEGASNLIDEWDKADGNLKLDLMKQVIPELAKLHESGVVQRDIHPENFLILGNKIYTIDGGNVIRRHQLRENQSLDNLALFLAQFHSRIDGLIPKLLQTYETARGWPGHSKRLDKLKDRVSWYRTVRKKNYIAKAFRECTRFFCQKDFSRFVVCQRDFDTTTVREILNFPDQAIDQGISLKRGSSATVAVVESDMGRLVIKRYNIKGCTHLLMRLFRKSRAWISWANTFRLEFLGINTLKPVALIEERIGPLRRRAYFITQYVEGDDASTLIERKNPDSEVISIAQIIKSMKAAGVSHGDLKASNFLLTEKGAVIIDLDSMEEHSKLRACRKAQSKDIERFLLNWSSSPSLKKRFADLLESS